MNKRRKLGQRIVLAALATSTVTAGTILNVETNNYAGINFSAGKQALAAGGVPADLTKNINASKASVEALGVLATACLGVALVPLGSMLSLKFLNMVMSRV